MKDNTSGRKASTRTYIVLLLYIIRHNHVCVHLPGWFVSDPFETHDTKYGVLLLYRFFW